MTLTSSSQGVKWQGQEAVRLTSGVIELIAKSEGGHLAELRFLNAAGASFNVLWESPWRGFKRSEMTAQDLAETAGITGHGLCLDRFGPPSEEEAALGYTPHGEAVTKYWNVDWPLGHSEAAARWRVRLPLAQLEFERSIRLGREESVVYVEERVANERDIEHRFDWVQHATFGPPFVNSSDTTFAASGKRGMTAEDAYNGCSRVALNQEFEWPLAPSNDGGVTDLRLPFTEKGKGLLAAVQLDPDREVEFVLAINWKLRLGVGYCFRRVDFPWMMVWEENGARLESPWNGVVQARGMEFGTTPFAAGRSDALRRGTLFDTASLSVLPGNGKKTARYVIFLFRVPDGMQSVEDVEVTPNAVTVFSKGTRSPLTIPARGCEAFLSSRDTSDGSR